MNNLMVKPVDVLGSSIMAAQDEKGRIFAGVNYFCNALGMTKGQRDKQVQKVQKDEVLKQGCFRLEAGVFDPANEAITLRIDFIPLWLAKIVITDKTKKDNPDLADKLLEYQLKAKDILAAAFMPKQDDLPKTTDGKIALLAQGHTELSQRVEGLEERFNKLEADMPVFTIDAKRIRDAVRKKAVGILGGKESNAYRDKSTRTYVFADVQCMLRRNFEVRRYEEIKHCQTDDALRLIEEHKPPLMLKNRVDIMNAQQTLDLEGGMK